MKKLNHLFSAASARALLLTILCGLYCGLPLTAAEIPTDGLVAYYPLNGNANDESGNGYHATPCNSYQFEDGIVGSCITVEGQGYMESSGGHILLPQFDFDVSSGVTLSLWVKVLGMTAPDEDNSTAFLMPLTTDCILHKNAMNPISMLLNSRIMKQPYRFPIWRTIPGNG